MLSKYLGVVLTYTEEALVSLYVLDTYKLPSLLSLSLLLPPTHTHFFFLYLKLHPEMIFFFACRPLVVTLIKMEIKKSVPLAGRFKLSLTL